MATTSATSASTGSNIDVASIVSQLMAVEQRPLTALARKEASYQAQISAYGSVKGALSSFQGVVSGLTDISKFQGLTTSSSDSTALTASAASTAAAGTYAIAVTSLAQSQKLVATGQASQTAAIGAGGATTLTFDFGTITGMLNTTTGKYSAGPTSTVASGVFTPPTSALNTGTYRLTVDGIDLQPAVAVDSAGTVVTAATLDASLATFLAANTGYSKTGSFAGNNLVLTKADGSAIDIVTTLGGDTDPLTGTFAGAGFVGTTAASPAAFLSNGNGTKNVSIDATNNSLQGIRDAINAANIGVTATIINDGSANPYRLSLSSNSQGVSNSVKISVAGDAALSALLAHDPANNTGQNLSETTAAKNANFTVNGVAVSKTSNSVSDVIQGVTLNLLKTSTTVNLSVAKNTSATSTAISGFVKAYNDLHTALNNVSSYNAATKQSAPLQGDFAVSTIQAQVRRVLNTAAGGTGALTTLSQIGVSFQKDGSLALDSTKLNAAIASNSSDIAALFATVGKVSDSLVSYSSAASSAKAGSYAVNISQLATQGKLTDGVTLAGLLIDGTNNTLDVTLDGVSASVTLAAGTYTAATLAAEVQSRINGASALSAAGASVAVTQSGGIFTITSSSYGSTSNVAIAGNGVANLLGAPTATAGLDVAGTIDGQATTGSGQFLTSGGGDSLGLKIQISGGALGARGTVSYSRGYAYTLNQLSTSLLSSNGLLDSKTTGLNKSIASIGKQRDAVNMRLAAMQKQYTSQFSALDVMLGKMNQTSSYLTQQLANLPKPY